MSNSWVFTWLTYPEQHFFGVGDTEQGTRHTAGPQFQLGKAYLPKLSAKKFEGICKKSNVKP